MCEKQKLLGKDFFGGGFKERYLSTIRKEVGSRVQ